MTALPKTSRPAARALAEAGIASLENLARHTEREVLSLHGMGPKAFGILKATMTERGLSFAQAPDPRRRNYLSQGEVNLSN